MQSNHQPGVLRILDAAANRAGEALRVVEDYARFQLDDRNLTELCKRLRHDLTAALAPLDRASRAAARDTLRDVGTGVTTAGEQTRADAADVVGAGFKRLQQSLRSLEEYAKIENVNVAAALEPLRYRAYTLERAVTITEDSRRRLENVRLMVLLGGGESPESLVRLTRSLLDAGARMFQLRDKRLGDRELLARARLVAPLIRDAQGLFVVNDRPDLAALADADGVHLGQTDVGVKDARSIVGARRLIGVSTHDLSQARQAVLDGANYLGVGPTFPSGTKNFEHFPGADFVQSVSREIALPAFAIGGISSENLAQVIAAGASRVAVSGAVVQSDDPAKAARRLLAAMKEGMNRGGAETQRRRTNSEEIK